MNEQAIIATAETMAGRMGAEFVPNLPARPFRAQLVNADNETAVWFEFDTKAEADLFAYRIDFAVRHQPVNAIVGAYPADAKCPRKKQ